MKKLIVIIGLVCWGKVFSQNDSAYSPRINQMSLQHFIETELQKNYQANLSNIGLSGVCYIRFQINANGEPTNIQVSPGTDETLAQFLKITLEKTNGYWEKASNMSMNSNEYIILPLEYNLQMDGKTINAKTEPQLLLSFFNGKNNSNHVKLIFLSKLEYTSPFDGKNSWKKISIKKLDIKPQ